VNIAMCVLAGAALGWIAFAYMRINAARGLVISVIIGAVGGFFGGNVLAPMLGAAVDTPNIFNPFSTLVAVASAAGCLAIGNLLSRRFGV
jgi:uncharacterized membrane protein YeaQ/YmgE (transglycosylase-associated protein family)